LLGGKLGPENILHYKFSKNTSYRKMITYKYCVRASILVLLIVFVSNSNVYAQEEASTPREDKHLIALSFGFTYIPEGENENQTETTGVFIPTLGLDYFFKIKQRWEIGLMTDIELGNYVIIDKELDRENAFIATAMGLYKISNDWSVFAGAGIELEKHKNLAVLRLGTDYVFSLGKGWVLGPGFYYDLKEGYDTWSISIVLGKDF
jgi:hypothetical protein